MAYPPTNIEEARVTLPNSVAYRFLKKLLPGFHLDELCLLRQVRLRKLCQLARGAALRGHNNSSEKGALMTDPFHSYAEQKGLDTELQVLCEKMHLCY